MFDTAVLERAPRMDDPSIKERTVTPAEEAHKNNIADNYRKLRFDNPEAYNAAREGEPMPECVITAAPVQESAPAPSYAAERISQYRPVASPKGAHDLFSGYTYKDGTLYGPKTTAQEAVLTAAPAAPAAEAVFTSAPITPWSDDEDAVPTRRTMDTLTRPAAKTAEGEAVKPGFLSMLSTKTKLVLAAVCAVILLAIVMIGVNSGLIRSMDLDIASKQSELGELTQQTQSIREQIADLKSPENIAEWAARNNMVLGE